MTWIEYRPAPDEGPEEKTLPRFGITIVPGERKQVSPEFADALMRALPDKIFAVAGPEEMKTRFPAPKIVKEGDK